MSFVHANGPPTFLRHHCLCCCTPQLLACTLIFWRDMIHQTIPAYSFARECGCWCLPMLAPQSLRQSCHEIVVVHKNSYLTGFVSSRLTRLCDALRMATDVFLCSERLISTMSRCSLASHSLRAGAPCSAVQLEHVAQRLGPSRSATPRTGWSACFSLFGGTLRPPVSSVEARRRLHGCLFMCVLTA